jgi:integrase
MPKKRLTEEGVRRLRPPLMRHDAKGRPIGSRDYFDSVMPGLVLRVNYGGRKVWRALYYVKVTDQDGKRHTEPRTRPLGLYPQLNLKEARDKARLFLADPHKALAHSGAGSFKEVADNFLKRHVEASELRSKSEIERCLNKYVYPQWQHQPFRELKRGHVTALLDHIEDKHGPRQADVVLAIISKLTRWYQARNDDYVSPVVHGMRRVNIADRKGKRVLSDHELQALFTCCNDCGSFGRLVKLLLLTAQRREKVATMKWDDVRDGVWHITTEPREKSNPGTLRLPAIALDIINEQPRIAQNPYVFAGSMKGRRKSKDEYLEPPAFNSFSQHKAELDSNLPDMPPWVLHDLRRTARSLMARAGVRPDIAERVLGHAIAGIEGVYDRHSYEDEKADALDRLACLVQAIVYPPRSTPKQETRCC